MFRRCWLLVPLSLLGAACSDTAPALEEAGASLRALTGTRTRVVWVQEDGTDPLALAPTSR